MGQNLVAVARGGGDGDGVALSGADLGNKGAKTDIELVDSEAKLGLKIVDILEAGFENVGATVVLAGGVLADSVGQAIGA